GPGEGCGRGTEDVEAMSDTPALPLVRAILGETYLAACRDLYARAYDLARAKVDAGVPWSKIERDIIVAHIAGRPEPDARIAILAGRPMGHGGIEAFVWDLICEERELDDEDILSLDLAVCAALADAMLSAPPRFRDRAS